MTDITNAVAGEQTSYYLNVKLKFGFWNGETPPSDFFGEINFTKFGLTPPKQETERLKSNMEGTVGQDLAIVQKPGADSFASLSSEFNRAPLALQALGMGADTSAFAQTGATVTDRTVSLAVGKWVPLWDLSTGPTPLASFTSLETSGDVAIDAAHYEVDLMGGMIRALDATGITGVKATFATATVAGVTFDAGKAISKYVMLYGTATDKKTNKRGLLTIHRAALAADGEWDVVSGTYLKGALSGSCETPQFTAYTRSSPYQFLATDVAGAG